MAITSQVGQPTPVVIPPYPVDTRHPVPQSQPAPGFAPPPGGYVTSPYPPQGNFNILDDVISTDMFRPTSGNPPYPLLELHPIPQWRRPIAPVSSSTSYPVSSHPGSPTHSPFAPLPHFYPHKCPVASGPYVYSALESRPSSPCSVSPLYSGRGVSSLIRSSTLTDPTPPYPVEAKHPVPQRASSLYSEHSSLPYPVEARHPCPDVPSFRGQSEGYY